MVRKHQCGPGTLERHASARARGNDHSGFRDRSLGAPGDIGFRPIQTARGFTGRSVVGLYRDHPGHAAASLYLQQRCRTRCRQPQAHSGAVCNRTVSSERYKLFRIASSARIGVRCRPAGYDRSHEYHYAPYEVLCRRPLLRAQNESS